MKWELDPDFCSFLPPRSGISATDTTLLVYYTTAKWTRKLGMRCCLESNATIKIIHCFSESGQEGQDMDESESWGSWLVGFEQDAKF